MENAAKTLLPLLISLSLLSFAPILSGADQIGVTYGHQMSQTIYPLDLISFMQFNNIGKIRLFEDYDDMLQDLNGTKIEVILNAGYENFINGSAATRSWVKKNVVNYYPHVNIKYIAVGIEIFSKQSYSHDLIRALKAVQAAIKYFGLDEKIKASIPHSVIDVINIATWSQPSSAEFSFDKKDFMKSMLGLLNNTKAPFMANVYPYFLLARDSVSTEFALFTQDTPSNDNGLLYYNAFDAMHDSVVAAMAKLGFHDIPIVVTETAWPSDDGQEGVANVENAGVYVNNLIKHVTSGLGTPAKKGINIPTYYFTIFDEDAKDGPLIWKNVGMFKADTSSKYYLDSRPLGVIGCECGQEFDSIY